MNHEGQARKPRDPKNPRRIYDQREIAGLGVIVEVRKMPDARQDIRIRRKPYKENLYEMGLRSIDDGDRADT